jgi:SAM-dependent methyltransferase
VVLIGYVPTPRDWFPTPLAGARVLCLASGGGQQGPVLAAAGAEVTVFDNSPKQLSRDELVADRDALSLRTVLGDMRDLSAFPDASFDVVFNPVSNVFCPDLAPVWRECHRVLGPGGILMTGFLNPDVFLFDMHALDTRGELVVAHHLPYSTLDLPTDERTRDYGDGPIEFSHTMTDQVGGQLAAGFVLTAFAEAPHHVDATAGYMSAYYATRAVKTL